MKKQIKMTQLKWEVTEGYLDNILQNQKRDISYHEDLNKFIEFIFGNISGLNIIEIFIVYNEVFNQLIELGIEEEFYEICGKLVKILDLETEFIREFISTANLEDEQHKQMILNELEDTINFYKIKHNK